MVLRRCYSLLIVLLVILQLKVHLNILLQSTAVMADNAVAITQNIADVTAQLNQAAQQFNADGNAGNDMRAILTNLKQTTDR